MHNYLKQHWHALWQSSNHDELFDNIITRYHQPHRHYHTLTHLYECFVLFDEIKHHLYRPKLVALALFYHDVIYNPKSHHNEQDSANFAKIALKKALTHDEIDITCQYIIATDTHKNTLGDTDLDYLLDIDLAILGADLSRFHEYNTQIRQEYAWVDALVYDTKRRQVLKSFYRRSPLFLTSYFYERLENTAKANLKHAIG